MKIEFDLNLTPQEATEIAQILGLPTASLPDALAGYGKAALQEYLAMMRGQKALKSGADIRVYRLFLLVENVFKGLPDEQTVSNIFQTTANESRTLLNSMGSKYQYPLSGHIAATLKALLEAATAESATGPYRVTKDSVSLIEALNKKLAAIDGTLTSISKKRGSVSTYEITPSSYQHLCTALGATPVVYTP